MDITSPTLVKEFLRAEWKHHLSCKIFSPSILKSIFPSRIDSPWPKKKFLNRLVAKTFVQLECTKFVTFKNKNYYTKNFQKT